MRSSGLGARKRRAYLRAECLTLTRLFSSRPGLLGPKLPVVLAALSQAQTEALSFYRHRTSEGGPPKNRSKHYAEDNFKDPLISILIGISVHLSRSVLRYRDVVKRYYAEYLRCTHLAAISKLVSKMPSSVLDEAPLFRSLPRLLEGISEDSNLSEFRFACERTMGALASQDHSVAIAEGIKRLSFAYEHSLYVDSLEAVISQRAELGGLWWYREDLFRDYYTSLIASDSCSKYASAYLEVMGAAVNNLSPYCPEEQLEIGTSSADCAERMAQEMAEKFGVILKRLIWQTSYFDDFTTPHEAFQRYDRAQQVVKAKKKGAPPATAQSQESLPGSESQGWATESVEPLVLNERTLVNLLNGASLVREVAIYDRLLVPQEFIRDEIAAVFREHIVHGLGISNTINRKRPSALLRNAVDGMRTILRVTGTTDMDVSASLRKVLLDQFTDWGRLFGAESESKQNVMDKMVAWYVSLLGDISPGGSRPGVVFVKERRGFVASPIAASNDTDLYLDEYEFEGFCALFGCSGARQLEQALLEVGTVKLALLLVASLALLIPFLFPTNNLPSFLPRAVHSSLRPEYATSISSCKRIRLCCRVS